MRSDARTAVEEQEVGDILVAVVRVVSSFAKATEDKPCKRAGRYRFCRIPDESLKFRV
jgi:hypothetical protein